MQTKSDQEKSGKFHVNQPNWQYLRTNKKAEMLKHLVVLNSCPSVIKKIFRSYFTHLIIIITEAGEKEHSSTRPLDGYKFFFSTERMVALFIEILNISCVKCCYIYFLFKSLKIIYSLSGRQLTGFALNPLVFRSIEILSNLQVHQFFSPI